MEEAEASRSAMLTATGRGIHRLEAAAPWVFDDSLALVLVGPAWKPLRAQLTTLLTEPLLRQCITMVVSRARYTEDRLAAGPFHQYVILGAGLDTFGWRRPDAIAGGLRVFEVDHPASQAWKLHRVEELGLPSSPGHVFVPVDFETEKIDACLDQAGFDWSTPAFFSWLGVTMYLTVDAIEATLRSLARSAPGSEVTFTYCVPEALWDEAGRGFHQALSPLLASLGEPLQTFFTPEEAEALVRRCGLDVVDHPTRAEIHARYYADRTDGLAPIVYEQVVTATVPGGPHR